MCLKHLPVNQTKQNDLNPDIVNRNYKRTFVQIMKKSNRLVSGANFKSTSFGPVEIEAISTYKNIVATGKPILLILYKKIYFSISKKSNRIFIN